MLNDITIRERQIKATMKYQYVLVRMWKIPLLGKYPKELRTGTPKIICIPVFTAALFTSAKKWKQWKCSTMNEWVNCDSYLLQNIT